MRIETARSAKQTAQAGISTKKSASCPTKDRRPPKTTRPTEIHCRGATRQSHRVTSCHQLRRRGGATYLPSAVSIFIHRSRRRLWPDRAPGCTPNRALHGLALRFQPARQQRQILRLVGGRRAVHVSPRL